MKTQIWMFFLLITSYRVGVCQLNEDFSSDEAFTNSNWVGDINDFLISDGLLRLNASSAGSSEILYPIKNDSDWELNLSLEMNFAPSLQNNLTLYIWSSSISLDMDDALYIKIGKNGMEDAIELYQRMDGEELLIGTGRISGVADSPNIRIKIIGQGQNIMISVDYQNGYRYISEIIADTELDLKKDGYFALQCDYTATRANKFSFDDIYYGVPRIDLESPKVSIFSITNEDATIRFSEALDTGSLNMTQFRLLPLDIVPVELNWDESSLSLYLHFDQFLQEQESYELAISNIQDLYDNGLDTIIRFVIPSAPEEKDILINEVLFNPIGDGSDYIEIINATGLFVQLDKMSISNATNQDIYPILNPNTIRPGEIVVFTDNKENILNHYPNHLDSAIYYQDIPRLNNDNGNVSIIYDGLLIDDFDYSEKMHNQLLNSTDGVSLERISIEGESNDSHNWSSASSAVGFGSPGLSNSLKSTDVTNIEIEFAGKKISPNGDGYQDRMMIEYKVNAVDYFATVSIYSENGALVNKILSNQPIGSSGLWEWDGRDQNGKVCSIGVYVFLFELYSLSGKRYVDKASVVLADYLD